MSTLQKSLALALALLLALTLYGLWSTGESVTPARTAHTPAPPASDVPVIDEGTFLTAQRLARPATTPEEIPLAQAAVDLADHELDLAFSGALLSIEAHPPVLSPQAARIQEHLRAAQQQLASDTEALNRLKTRLAQASDAEKPALQDQLDLLQSQVELEQDEVAEANHDLLEAGGNAHQRIQLAQQEHEAALHNTNAITAAATPSPLAVLHGMVEEVRQWFTLRAKRQALQAARANAVESAARLGEERTQLAAELAVSKQHAPGTAAASPTGGAAPGLIAQTRQLAADQRLLTLRDQRVSARKRLAHIYGKWDAVVATQQRTVLHALLVGASIVLGALLLLLLANRWLSHLLGRARIDRRQLETLRSVTGVALQIVGVLLIIFVLIGVPGQFGTMLGIAGAGLTVALKDFIVAFIGWFVLMGRNGIRLGDWVEINGVSGEVVELGMFRTVLLETGNWTDAGHPTGRHVTFTNSFAIEGHYFNFSTSGQWLWDELTVVVPFGRDAQAVAAALQKEVTEATADSARQAEQEWQRASHGTRGSTLAAQPGIAVRPAVGGVEIAVRYVTRASERYALRAKLYQSAVQLLSQQAPA